MIALAIPLAPNTHHHFRHRCTTTPLTECVCISSVAPALESVLASFPHAAASLAPTAVLRRWLRPRLWHINIATTTFSTIVVYDGIDEENDDNDDNDNNDNNNDKDDQVVAIRDDVVVIVLSKLTMTIPAATADAAGGGGTMTITTSAAPQTPLPPLHLM